MVEFLVCYHFIVPLLCANAERLYNLLLPVFSADLQRVRVF